MDFGDDMGFWAFLVYLDALGVLDDMGFGACQGGKGFCLAQCWVHRSLAVPLWKPARWSR